MLRVPASTEFVPRAQANDELTAVLAANAVVAAGAKIRLIDTDFAFTPAMTFASLHEATYAGYAAATFNWATMLFRQNESNGRIRVESSSLAVFTGPTSGGPVTIYGWAITESAGTTHLFRVYKLLTPMVMEDDLTVLNIIPIMEQFAGQTLN